MKKKLVKFTLKLIFPKFLFGLPCPAYALYDLLLCLFIEDILGLLVLWLVFLNLLAVSCSILLRRLFFFFATYFPAIFIACLCANLKDLPLFIKAFIIAICFLLWCLLCFFIRFFCLSV